MYNIYIKTTDSFEKEEPDARALEFPLVGEECNFEFNYDDLEEDILYARVCYTYLIGWSNLDRWYYGVRYAKDCHPFDFWYEYQTSSKHVKNFIKNHGEPDVLQIRKIFYDIREARAWESKVLRRMKVVGDKRWLNVTAAPGISNIGMSMWNNGKVNTWALECPGDGWVKGKFVSSETRKNMSDAAKLTYQNGREGTFKGKTHSEEARKKLSDSKKGEKHPFYGKKRPDHAKKISEIMKGRPKSEEHKRKISESHNVVYTCPHCNKQGGRLLLRWHFDHCKFKSNP